MSWVLRTTLSAEELDAHVAVLPDAGLLGVEEQGGQVRAWFRERVALPVEGTWEEVADQDWNAEARRHLQPVRVGDLVVTPPWVDDTPAAALRVVVDPAQAFGTGHHETTTGCLAALQELDLAGRRVLDVGTGSGVLAIAAALLGASDVVAIDNDPLAVEATESNAARNAVHIDARLAVPADLHDAYDVVLANLDTATITLVAHDLARLLAPRGTLIASGVSVARIGEGLAALEGAGLVVWPRPGQEWVLFTGRHAV